ncbi:hypothetical protein CYG49_02410, partial [Candidatus Saccharibacteria bacterium]
MAKILIIEDDTRLELTYNIIFEQSGHTVIRAHDGEEGLQKAEAEEPNLILLDLNMPKMGGLEFLRRYDVINKHPFVKVVVFSNMQTEESIREAYSLGAYKYEVKATFSPKQVGALVEQAL